MIEILLSKAENNFAWGLEFGGSAVRLVRVRRIFSGGGPDYRAEMFREVPFDERWRQAPNAASAVERMGEQISGPLVACVSDELVLFRTLSLPPADAAALDKMVHSQLEILIPTQTEQFASGYRSFADPYKAESLVWR